MCTRVFAFPEAVESLENAHRRLKRLRQFDGTIAELKAELEILHVICVHTVTVDSPDLQQYLRVNNDLLRETSARDALLYECIRLGFLFADVAKGIIHFLCRYRGEIAVLCWKEGDERILHYHLLTERNRMMDEGDRIVIANWHDFC